MQLRRFIANSTPTALDAVRNAFGTDAIILANRKIGNDVEIIATGKLDEDALDRAPFEESDDGSIDTVSAEAAVTNPSKEVCDSDATTEASITESDLQISGVNTQTTNNIESDTAKPLAAVAENTVDHKSELSTTTDSMMQSELHLVKSLTLRELEEHLEEHLEEQLDDRFARLETRFKGIEINLWGCRNPHRRDLLGQLLSMGIGAELAIHLSERVSPESSLDESIRQTMSLLADSISVGSSEVMMMPGITVLTGLSGSGKSTVMMKLASEYVSRHGTQSIVLICADTSKIGAFESIQVFGKLLGVPVVQAHTPDELDNLLLAFKHKSMILVEHAPTPALRTIGHEQSAEMSLDRQSGYVCPGSSLGGTPDVSGDIELDKTSPDAKGATPAVRRVAVLSAASQSASIEALVSRKEELGLNYCMLSHLDEQAKLGELFSTLIRHQLRVVSWSDSAALQKPMQKADASVLVATAIAMSKRLIQSADDTWLLHLLQPSGITDRHTPMPQFSSPTEEFES